MDDSLSISRHDTPKVFSCPACGQTINTSVASCPFCMAAIDPGAAASAALSMERISRACSEASYIRSVAGMAVVFFGFSLLPLVGGMSEWGLKFVLVACPVMAIRWWIRYRQIVTDDEDFRSARRTVIWTGVSIAVLLALYVSFVLVMAWWRR